MHIAYDVASLQEPQLTGIGKSTLHLLQALSRNGLMRPAPCLKASRWKKRAAVEAHVGNRVRWYLPALPLSLHGIDVFHGPDFRLPLGRGFAKVVTIHDLVEFRNEYNSEAFIAKARADMQWMINRAKPDIVIAISEFTKRELLSHFPQVAGRVRVIPHGADHLAPKRPDDLKKAGQREKTILFVGTIEKRKNVGRLIRAFLSSCLPGQGYRLKIVGKRGFAAEAELTDAHHPAVELLGYLPQDRLNELYRDSAALAFPSLYEGFGLPLLEALSWALPVLTSQGTACAETVGSAAVLIDPFSVESIRQGLEQLA